MITAQPSNLDTIYISTLSTNDNTIDTLLFAEDEEFPPDPNAKNPEAFLPPTTEKDDEEGKSEEIDVNTHNSDTMAHESAEIRKIQYGVEIVFKND